MPAAQVGQVGQLCQREVDLVDVKESIREAAQRMAHRSVGTLVIVDAKGAPVGIITDRDLITRALAAGKDPLETKVGEIMTRGPETVLEETPIEKALAKMRAGSFRRIPVVNQSGRLVGIVSLDDLVLKLAIELGEVRRILESQTPAKSL